jgi:hypothetical protein
VSSNDICKSPTSCGVNESCDKNTAIARVRGSYISSVLGLSVTDSPRTPLTNLALEAVDFQQHHVAY